MTRKICAKCKRRRLAKFFWKNRRMKSGLASYCKECAGEVNKRSAQKWAATRPRCELRRRLKKYGITADTYHQMVAEQRAGCAVCGEPPRHRARLCVDHCHTTGTVRGLLCTQCNAGLGQFYDEPDRLRAAANYLEAS